MPLDPKIMAMDDSRDREFIIFSNILFSVKLCTCLCSSINESMNMKILVICLNVGFFFYNLKAVLINIFIVNLRPSSKFIAGDTVILRIHFQKKKNE